MHFQRKSVFGQCRVHFFTNTHHIWFVEFIRLFRGSFRILEKSPFWRQNAEAVYHKYAFLEGISFWAIQGLFLLQCSPFLVCRLVLWKFSGFCKNHLFGVKNAQICTKVCIFRENQFSGSEGCVSSPMLAIFGFQA